MSFQVRRARRTDLGSIFTLLQATDLPAPERDRADLKRFRNIVADLGCDFDVACTRNGVRGFVHLSYARDLLRGNRAHLLALVADSNEIQDALVNAGIRRAQRRRCHDLTVSPGPWNTSLSLTGAGDGWQLVEGCLRIDLSGRREAQCLSSPAARR